MRAPSEDPDKVRFLVMQSFPEIVDIEHLVYSALGDAEDQTTWDEYSISEQIKLVDDPRVMGVIEAPQLVRLKQALQLGVELERLSSATLTARFEPLWTAAQRIIQDKAASDSEAEWLSTQVADFEHWSSLPYWTVREAVCLSFGIDPGSEGDEFRNWPHRLAKRRIQLTLRLSRALETGQLGRSSKGSPGEFARWFVRMGIDRPSQFEALTELPNEISKGGEDEPRGRAKQSLYRMIFSLAFPKAESMPDERAIALAVKRIQESSTRAGHPIDDETARGHLRAAVESAANFVKFSPDR